MTSTETSTTDDNITINTFHDPKESSSSSPDQCISNSTPDKKLRTLFDTICLVILFIGVILSMFVMSLNSTVVAPAMTIIAAELDALSNQTWIATAYLLAVNAFQPISGKLSDIFGRKPVLLFGLSFFVLGSLINALTPSVQGLIAGRTIQGAGAGFIMSLVFVIITDIAPVDWRPRLQSVLVIVYGLASVVGPLLDFWINVILGGVALVIIAVLFKETSTTSTGTFRSKLKRVDFIGCTLSIGFIVCLLLALNWGPLYGWGDAHSIATFVVAGVLLILLIIAEFWFVKEPILPAEVLLDPNIFVIYLYMACLGLTFIGTLYFGPILYQSVFGASSSESGIRLIPFMACLIAGSIASGLLLKFFPYVKLYILIGAASNLIGYGLFFTVDETANWGRQAGFLTFCGLAFGLSQQNCILGVQTAASKYMAVATSLNNFVMLLASSIGVALYQTLFSTFLQAQFKGLSSAILQQAAKYGALSNYLYIRDMPQEYQGPIIHAYMEALHNVFIVPLVAGGVGFICALFVRNIRYGQGTPSANNNDRDLEKVELQQQQQQQ
ncbi:potential mfs-mdr transporter [Lichtheimia corymbifera JMRC:FSU:9682]|uniref:Potential mfs-mdr transporter n=1 Tax=Lichtheimia corymbifera JMRC:FSU:9682 TaxID=1263082 RepID=A0A068S8X9_9FUNG|nr:potential mfs-mdr transporter [Lichtheimia corymbifera JMRC:FSU:9682]